MKWTYKQKIKWVKDYIENGITPRINGVNYLTLRKHIIHWSHGVRINGYGCLRHRFTSWSLEDKLNAVNKVINDKRSVSSVSQELGMGDSSVLFQWVRKYQLYGISGLKLDKRGRTRTMKKVNGKLVFKNKDEELEYLRAENAVLKKLAALVQTRKERESKKK